MANTTQEHERTLDIFDEIITFSYACEWQHLKNNSINELLELRDSISSYIENMCGHESLISFLTSTDKKVIVHRILTNLNKAVMDNSYPKIIDFVDVWLNLSNMHLIEKQDEELGLITNLVMSVVSSLNLLLPDEVKPFVTIEQVDAIFRKSWAEMSNRITVPIHKELLLSIIHQYFLMTFSLKQDVDKDYLYELVGQYCKKAKHKYFKMYEEKIIGNAVIYFFFQGKSIELDIGQYYPWTMICYGEVDCQNELLLWYSSVNALDRVQDGRYKGDKTSDNDITDLKLRMLLNKELNYSKYTPVAKGDFKQYIFDSNRTPILVDGNSLQNHILMAFPYDKPFPDLQEKLRNYGCKIGEMVKNYGRTYGHPAGCEDEVNSAISFAKIDSPYKRISLSDVGSVLMHICSLLCLQFERSTDYADKQKKCQSLDTLELINKYGFRYSYGSVNTARKSKEDRMLGIVTKFHNPSHNSS